MTSIERRKPIKHGNHSGSLVMGSTGTGSVLPPVLMNILLALLLLGKDGVAIKVRCGSAIVFR